MTPKPNGSTLGRIASALGPWRGILGYAAFTLAVFVVALLYGLPHDLIAERAIAEATRGTNLHVATGDISFSFPNGYHLEAVRVSDRDDPRIGVEIDELDLTTPLLGLLLGQTGANFSGRLYQGTIEGQARQTEGTGFSTQIDLRGVALGTVSRRFLPPPGTIGGTGSIRVDLTGDGSTTRSLSGTVKLRARDVALKGLVAQGFTVPDLDFSRVSLDATIEDGRLQVETFDARGTEVSGTATGDVLLRDPAHRSVLNLEFDLDVAKTARPGLRVATSLLPPKKAGTKGWKLRGSLAAPSLR